MTTFFSNLLVFRHLRPKSLTELLKSHHGSAASHCPSRNAESASVFSSHAVLRSPGGPETAGSEPWLRVRPGYPPVATTCRYERGTLQ